MIIFIISLAEIEFVQADESCFISNKSRNWVNVGDQAPDFTVSLSDHSSFTLYDHLGAVILINLFSPT